MTTPSNGTRQTTPGEAQVEADFARVAKIDAEMAQLQVERKTIIARYVTRNGASAPVTSLVINASADVDAIGQRARERGQHPGSFAARIVSHLEARPDHVFTITEVHSEIGQGLTKRRIRTALYDLTRRKKLDRLEHGRYRALKKEVPSI